MHWERNGLYTHKRRSAFPRCNEIGKTKSSPHPKYWSMKTRLRTKSDELVKRFFYAIQVKNIEISKGMDDEKMSVTPPPPHLDPANSHWPQNTLIVRLYQNFTS